jgi:outer membrane receptor for ferric coprogen and ferric-rhodotorulic acid
LLYGILEADVTSSTRVSLGASYDKLKATPWREACRVPPMATI